MSEMWGPGTPWKTEAKWWAWVRGGLRRAVWNKHPIKLTHLKEHRYKAPLGRGGKDVWACQCAICEKEYRQAECQVDHINPAGSLKCIDDITPFVLSLAFIKDEDIRILCKQCHGIVTYSERYGVTFEEAAKRKEEIRKKKEKKC